MTEPTTIRLDEKTKVEADKKREAYGLPSLSALIRFAVLQLKTPKKQ